MFTCHFSVYRKSLLIKIGGFDENFDGAQDYEMALRFLKEKPNIAHIADILYSWRAHINSTAKTLDAKPLSFQRQVKALNNYLKPIGEVADGKIHGMHKVNYYLQKDHFISIVIPTAGKTHHLFKDTTYIEHLIKSIQEKTSYRNYEIVISVNSDFPAKLKSKFDTTGVRIEYYNEKKFNLSTKINQLVKSAENEFVVLLNDDMEIISDDWLSELLMLCQLPDVGVVGGKLLFPNDKVQHAGVCFTKDGPGHCFYNFPDSSNGYAGFLNLTREYIAVTGACMMFNINDFLKVGGFDKSLHLNYNDVDFCLKIKEKCKKSIVYSPYVKLYHYESVSKSGTSKAELDKINSLWPEYLSRDPFVNPHQEADNFRVHSRNKTTFEKYYNNLR